MDPAIFKAYDIRGVYPDQVDEEAARIDWLLARWYRSGRTERLQAVAKTWAGIRRRFTGSLRAIACRNRDTSRRRRTT